MAVSHAQTGDIAAKAGNSTGGAAAIVEGAAKSEGAGQADVAGDAPQNSSDNTPKTDEITPESAAKVLESAAKTVETALKASKPSKEAKNTQKVKFLRSHPAYAYHAGETGKLPVEQVAKLVQEGYVELVLTA